MCVHTYHWWLFITVVLNAAQNSSDNFFCYPSDNRYSSDNVYWREGGSLPQKQSNWRPPPPFWWLFPGEPGLLAPHVPEREPFGISAAGFFRLDALPVAQPTVPMKSRCCVRCDSLLQTLATMKDNSTSSCTAVPATSAAAGIIR